MNAEVSFTGWDRQIRPNLIVPGAAKCGTSTLHELLGGHPSIFMPKRKEPHFFSRNPDPNEFERYRALFTGTERFLFRGESSTSYFICQEAIERISNFFPEMRFVVILRNPVDRTFSHYRWLRSLGLEWRSLESAFLFDKGRPFSLTESVFGSGNFRYYSHHSAYGTNIKRIVDTFGQERCFVITLEELRGDVIGVINSCFSFLGVGNIETVESIHANRTTGRVFSISRAVFEHLLLRKLPRGVRHPISKAISPLRRLFRGLDSRFSQRTHVLLSDEGREFLVKQLSEEVSELRQITGRRFMEWARDFPVNDEIVQK